MPTPRYHGGAALVNIPLSVPGFRGLNKQQQSSTLGPEWATRMENCVFDDSSRLASRKGWSKITTTPASVDEFVTLFSYVQNDGTEELIGTTSTAIYASADGGTSWTEVTGTASFTDGQWHFVNFNDRVYGFQTGMAPIYYSGTSFASVADVNAPTGGVGLSAFGRLWVVDADGVTVKYSALLDGTDWTSVDDAGQISLQNVWSRQDTVKALAAFNGALVIFGKWNILFYTDGRGSAIGLDPLYMYLVDTISGTGCIAQKSVQEVNGDLWFIGPQGLMSLGRLIQEKSNPLENLSKNVQDWFSDLVGRTPEQSIRTVFDPEERLFLVSLPNGAGAGTAVAFDTRGFMEDGSVRCAGAWNGLVPTDMVLTEDYTLIMAKYGNTGEVGKYFGHLDDSSSFQTIYESGWLDLDNGKHLKILKRMDGIFYIDRAASVTFKWAFDFEDTFKRKSLSFADAGISAEFNIAEFNLAEFSGGVTLRKGRVPASRKGEYVKIGIEVLNDGFEFSLQELELFARIGRLA